MFNNPFFRDRVFFICNSLSEKQLLELKEDIIKADNTGKGPIYLGIDSNGGNIFPALHLIDAIGFLDNPVVGIVIGRCMSAAFTLLQKLNLRLATPRSSFLIHSPRMTVEIFAMHSNREINMILKEATSSLRMCQRQTLEIISARTGISIKQLERMIRAGDRYERQYSAQEALELGFVDSIIENEEQIMEIVKTKFSSVFQS